MSKKALLFLTLLSISAFLTSCKGSLFGEDLPANREPSAPPAPLVVDGMRVSYADVVDKTSPAVVRIEADHKAKPQAQQQQQAPFGEDFFRQFGIPGPQGRPQQGPPPVERGLGSGVIVSADGIIVTNNHVVEGADKITVQMSDNKTYEATVKGTDKPSDMAVLKIEGQNFPFLTLGNSDSVRVGDIVLAIGNPLGIGQSVTSGIISAKGRRTGLSDGSFEDFLQTDAPINRGNSGGALVNLQGELIGINSQILSPGGASGGNIGIGFSIPSNMAKSVMDQLVATGKVRRGRLGVGIQAISADLAEALELKSTSGVLVSSVTPGSSADKAGIKQQDVIIAINGEKTEDPNVLRNKVAGTLPGTAIKVTVLRGGKEEELSATLDEFEVEGSSKTPGDGSGPGADEPKGESGKLGISMQPLTPQIVKELNLPAGTEGMVVSDVDAAGAAAEAGIRRGDVVREINRKPVKTDADVEAALGTTGGKPVLLLVSRGGQSTYLTVKPR